MKNGIASLVLGSVKGGTPMRGMTSALAVTTVLAALLAGCAQDIGTVDRVQQNIAKKSDLLFKADGTRKEWHVQQTVIEAPYASAYAFPGSQGQMERGVFDVQEGILYFYRTYTAVEGEYAQTPRHDTDQRLLNKDGTPYLLNGQEVWMDKNAATLAFPIEAHLDVIWEYNPNTGEKTNVRVENSSDRLWNEREYVRVTWGANLVPGTAGTVFINDWNTGFAEMSAIPNIFHDDAASPELESRITPEKGYMDAVNEWIYGAQTEANPEYGTIPLCWYYAWYSGGIYECISERIRTRMSFVEVDPARETAYESVQYTDHDMERFGYFRTERLVWDRDYGTSYSGFRRFLNRFDIWQKDADGKVVGVKPIVYHLSEGFPADLLEEGVQVGVQWSTAFDAAVKAATGKNPSDFPAYTMDGVPMVRGDGSAINVEHMFVVCENNADDLAAHDGVVDAQGNPVTAEIEAGICGDLKEHKRLGDLRYSFLTSHLSPTQVGLYGFGPPSPEPLSGRIVVGNANMYNAAMRDGAQRALDRIELLSGVKSFREVANADYIAQEVRTDRLQQSTYWRSGYTNDEAVALAQKLVASDVAGALTANPPQKTDQNFTATRMAILQSQPDVQAMFVNDDVRLLFKDLQLGTRAPATLGSADEKMKLGNWSNAAGTRRMIQARLDTAKKGLDMASFYDGAILRLSDEYKARYDQAICERLAGVEGGALDFGVFGEGNPCTAAALIEQMRRAFAYANASNPYGFESTYIPTPLELSTNNPQLRITQDAFKAVLDDLRVSFREELYKRIWYGVAVHEVGHSLGLRHNFEASTDSLNFKPGYWDLKVQKNGNAYEPVGLWGETPAQVAGGLREYQYSSVMDYYMKFNMPWLGIGLYDVAAIKYAYAGTVEVFNQAPDLRPVQNYVTVDPSAGAPGNVPTLKDRGEGLGLAIRRFHHTNIPNLFGDIAKIYDRRDVPKAEVIGESCSSEGQGCGGDRVCKRFYEGLRCSSPDTMVPYRFGGDELASGLPTVATWDEGVDPYEIVNNARELYENTWVWSGYWHQDPTYWPTMYDGTVRMLFYGMRSQYQWWVLNYATYNHNDYWKNRFGKRWEEDVNGGLPGALAAHMSFNTMVSAFGRPEPGVYGYNWQTRRYEPLDEVNRNNYTTQMMLLEESGARPIYSSWDYSGYSPVVTTSGAIYDRLAAFEMLSDPETWFIGADNNADTRKYMINYGTMFREEMRELFGGLMANNATKYGWCVLEHPESSQPMTFAAAERIGAAAAGDPCAAMYQGCFAKDASGYLAKTPRLLARSDEPLECGAGEAKSAITGISLEPEPLYTFPTTRFRIPMLAAYYGMSLLVNNYDMSFMDTARIWLKGDKYAIDPPAGAEVATCEDVFSGRVYQTYRQNDGRYYPAYDLVKQCDFMFSCYDPVRNDTLDALATDECKAIAQGLTEVKDLTLDDLRANYLFHPLQFLVGKLELIRAMHASFEYGEGSATASGN